MPASDAPLKLPWPGTSDAAPPAMSRALARVLYTAECKENDMEAEERPQVIPVGAGKNSRTRLTSDFT